MTGALRYREKVNQQWWRAGCQQHAGDVRCAWCYSLPEWCPCRGYRISDDVQIIGFDNVSMGRFTNPSLTSVDPPASDFANQAVKMLIERIIRLCRTGVLAGHRL